MFKKFYSIGLGWFVWAMFSAPCVAETRFFAASGTSDWYVQERAAGHAIDQFMSGFQFGKKNTATTSQNTSGQAAVDPQPKADFSDVSYTIRIPKSFTLGVRKIYKTHNHLSFGLETSITRSNAAYYLPDGIPKGENIPALPDPLSIEFDSVSLRGQAGATYHFDPIWQDITPKLGLWLGHDMSRVKTSITSNLLDINSTQTLHTSFYQLRISADIPRGNFKLVPEFSLTHTHQHGPSAALQFLVMF